MFLLFTIGILLTPFAHAAGHAVSFTFSSGAFAGAKVEEGRPVLVRRYDAKAKKFSAASWGTLTAVDESVTQKPAFEVTSANGRASRFSLAEITPEAESLQGKEGGKFAKGQRVDQGGKPGTVEALFSPDYALVREDGAPEPKLVRLSALAPAGPPPPPRLPDLRVEVFEQFVSSEFQLEPANSSSGSNQLTFRPAASYYLGVGAGYKGIGASYSFSIPASGDTRAAEGTSEYKDLRLNYYSRRFAVELAFSRYTGYLIDNSNVLSASALGGQKYYKLPNLNAEGYGANFLYVFAPETYSLPAGNDHSEIETQSAGSLLGIASFRRQAVRNNGPIIPAEKQALFGDEGSITGFRTFSYGAGPGYGYHWLPGWKVLGDYFYVAPLLALSLGYEAISEDLVDRRRESGVFGVNVHVRLGFGWNYPRFFVLINALADAFSGQTGRARFDSTQTSAGLTVGGRF